MSAKRIQIELESFPLLEAKFEAFHGRKMGNKHLRIVALLAAKLKRQNKQRLSGKIPALNWDRLYVPCSAFAAISKRHYCKVLTELTECGILGLRSGGVDRLAGYICHKARKGCEDLKGVCKFCLFSKESRYAILRKPSRTIFVSEHFQKLPEALDATERKDEACHHVKASYARCSVNAATFRSTSEGAFAVAEKVESGIANARKTKTGRITNTLLAPHSKEVRPHVLIDGKPTVELDMKQAHPRLIGLILDGKEGQEWAKLCEGDFYKALCESSGIEASREQMKALFQRALSATSGQRKTKPRQLKAWLQRHFPSLFDFLAASSSAQAALQGLESRIINGVVLYSASRKIPIIPLYDGFLCLEENANDLAARVGLPMERKS